MHSLLNLKTQLSPQGEVPPAGPKKTAGFDRNESTGFESMLAGVMPVQQNIVQEQPRDEHFKREEPLAVQKESVSEDNREQFASMRSRREESDRTEQSTISGSENNFQAAALHARTVLSKEPANTFEQPAFSQLKSRDRQAAARENSAHKTFGDFASMKSMTAAHPVPEKLPTLLRDKDFAAALAPLAERMRATLNESAPKFPLDTKKFVKLSASEMAALKVEISELAKKSKTQSDAGVQFAAHTKDIRDDMRAGILRGKKDAAAAETFAVHHKIENQKSVIKENVVALNDVRPAEVRETAKKDPHHKTSSPDHIKTEIASAQTVNESAKSSTEQNNSQNFSFAKNFDQTVGTRDAVTAQPSKFKMPFADEQLQTIINNAKITVRDARNGNFVMQLNPESLGRVNVNLGLVDGVVTGKFLVDSQDAKDALLASMNEIKENLENAGISVGEFHVDVRDSGERLYKERKELLDAFSSAFSQSGGREENPAASGYDSNARLHDGQIDMVI